VISGGERYAIVVQANEELMEVNVALRAVLDLE
jgi:hypothetical protein